MYTIRNFIFDLNVWNISRSVVGENLSQFLVLLSLYLLWIKIVGFQSMTTSIENECFLYMYNIAYFVPGCKICMRLRKFSTRTVLFGLRCSAEINNEKVIIGFLLVLLYLILFMAAPTPPHTQTEHTMKKKSGSALCFTSDGNN